MKEEPQEPDTEKCVGCPPGKHFLWKESGPEGNDRGRRWAACEEWQPVRLDRGIWSDGLQVMPLGTSGKGVCLLLHFRATTCPGPLPLPFGPASFHKKVVYF